jgi:hypothetical protein
MGWARGTTGDGHSEGRRVLLKLAFAVSSSHLASGDEDTSAWRPRGPTYVERGVELADLAVACMCKYVALTVVWM